MKCQSLFPGQIREKVISLSSADLAQRVVKFKYGSVFLQFSSVFGDIKR